MNCPTLPELPPPPPGTSGWPWTEESPHLPLHMLAGRPWPKISIVTPSFNQGQFLEETIRSVLLQGYPNLEYIIIDGGSTDSSVEIIKKYESWLVYWVSEKDGGQSEAINKGFERTTGDILAWINSDDIYLPKTFYRVSNVALNSSRPAWIVGTTFFFENDINQSKTFQPQYPMELLGVSPFWLNFVCTKLSGISLPQPSSFWSRKILETVGPLNEQLHYAMDHELYGRIASFGFRPICINEPLAGFRLHKEQKSAETFLNFWLEELKVVDYWIQCVGEKEKRLLIEYKKWFSWEIKRKQLENSSNPFIRKIARTIRNSKIQQIYFHYKQCHWYDETKFS